VIPTPPTKAEFEAANAARLKPENFLIEGSAIRFAPTRTGEPASSIWKMWSAGSEIYSLSRDSRGTTRISAHQSGQVHLHLGKDKKQILASPIQLELGPWHHLLELRFLLADGLLSPRDPRKSLKKNKAYLIYAPEGFVLYANLLVAEPDTPPDFPLPKILQQIRTIWRARLRDRRLAVLGIRVMKPDQQTIARAEELRTKLRPTFTFDAMPKNPYTELHDVHWSQENGNVILVAPLGEDAFAVKASAGSATQVITPQASGPR